MKTYRAALVGTGSISEAHVRAVEATQGRVVLEAAVDIDATRVADLYCGLGTFALPLAKGRKMRAVDGDAAAVAVLQATARSLNLAVTAETRDLQRRPPVPAEIADVVAGSRHEQQIDARHQQRGRVEHDAPRQRDREGPIAIARRRYGY